MDNLLGEFLGTLFLVLLGDAVVANVILNKTKGNNSGWIVITAGWFIAVMVGVFICVSAGAPQGDINPAVTLGKWAFLTNADGTAIYTAPEALATMAAQLIGAFVGAIIVWLAYYQHFDDTEDQGAILGTFSTGPAIRSPLWNSMTEIIGTIVLLVGVGAIFGIAAGETPASNIGPFLVGALVWGIGLSLGGPTGYAINPARDLGPRIAHAILPIKGKGGSDWGYSWIPVIMPLIGGLIGAFIWSVVF
ncbi:MAG: aquaporin family protein [Anaerolineae bacterium]|nr:aquaporin family protein [Anaerolineae bacterium]MCO5196816.1 aquaporin family protein [Anaerolineae bacterium]